MSVGRTTDIEDVISRYSERRTATDAPRIVVADDQLEMLQEISLILGDDFCVIGRVNNGKDAIELTACLHPDALVLDISMPVVNGIEVAFHLKTIGSHTRIIFLTVHDDPEFVDAALSAGALGYVLKTSVTTDLIPAIWSALQGKVFVPPALRVQ